jgi:hypothetical protein
MTTVFYTRFPRSPRHVILRRHGVAIGPTLVDEEHMERVRRARRRLGLDEDVTVDG